MNHRIEWHGPLDITLIGAEAARGDLLVFVDADTLLPQSGLRRAVCLARAGYAVALFPLAPQRPSLRGRTWCAFWNGVRRLPLARAEALPAYLFCIRGAFEARSGLTSKLRSERSGQ